MISGVNYAAQQHAEKKVPSVAKYVHVCACERENKNMSLFYSISLRFGVDRGLLDALEAAYNEVYKLSVFGNIPRDADVHSYSLCEGSEQF